MRDARGFEPQPGREMSDEDLGLANVILAERRALLRRSRPPGVLDTRVPARRATSCPRQGGGADPRALARGGRAPTCRRHAGPVDLQEQLRRQGQLVRHPRELPRRPRDARSPTSSATSRRSSSRDRCSRARARWGSRGNWDDRVAAGLPAHRARRLLRDRGRASRRRLKRPIINTRDEPHADPEKYRRLHVIVGDANLCEVAQFLKMGHDRHRPEDDRGRLPAGLLARRTRSPRSTRSRATSSLGAPLELADGRRMTARPAAGRVPGARAEVRRPRGRHAREPRGDRPLGVGARRVSATTRCPWRAAGLGGEAPRARGLPRARRARRGATRSSARSICSTTTCAATRGLYDRLAAAGKVERLTTDEEVERADDGAARGHARVLPRSVHLAVPRRHRRGVVGLRDHGHRAARRCSASRCASRSRAPAPTSRSFSRPARPPPTWSTDSRRRRSPAGCDHGPGGRMSVRKGAHRARAGAEAHPEEGRLGRRRRRGRRTGQRRRPRPPSSRTRWTRSSTRSTRSSRRTPRSS